MNDTVLCKMTGIKFPSYQEAKVGHRSEGEVVEVNHKDNIKNEISRLMMGGYDNVLVSYNGKYYLCHNTGEGNFVRREVNYHPLISKIS